MASKANNTAFQGSMPWYKSKIIIGALVSIISKVLLTTGLIDNFTPEDSEQLTSLIVLLIGAAGDVLAIGARITQKRAPEIRAA